MRFRGSNNAASVGCTATAFVAAGCAIAVWAVLAKLEAPVIKLGIVAYLFMTVPLFLASLVGGTSRPKHKSFRATPPAYMAGKRVKRRLRLIASANSLIFVTTLTLTFVGQLWALSRFGHAPDRSVLVSLVFMMGPLAAAYLASTIFWTLSARCGWLTPEEARSRRDRPRRGWPEAWLEPGDKKDGV